MRKTVPAMMVVLVLVLGLLLHVKPPGLSANLGGHWAVEAVASPAGTELVGVSCARSDWCTAVGQHAGPLTPVALIWDGRTWTWKNPKNLPSTPGRPSSGGLDSVSCPSPTDCIAVGPWLPGQQPLGEHWDGQHWRLALPHRSPLPLRAGSLSCPADDFCVVVGPARAPSGDYVQSGDGRELGPPSRVSVQRWNGSKWYTSTWPGPVQAIMLDGVSCSSQRFCMAVGTGFGAVVAERWDGARWRSVAAASPSSSGGLSTEHGLSAVSCTSASNCVAVGDPTQGTATGLAELWDGSHWHIEPTPAMANAAVAADFTGVSCASPEYCVAVGASAGPAANQAVALVELWDGAKWTVMPTPATAQPSVLVSVSCTSAGSCLAVGFTVQAGKTHALVERFVGT